ncbi:Nn.00g032360.m01.CDS01 [Neocucurbitaria sp. VM-36]
MQPFTRLTSLADYTSSIPPSTGKTLLIAYWPEDTLSNALITTLRAQLPPSSYAQYGILDIYCFDAYALPELGTELDVAFVPTLMWFMDGVMDAVVWHEGVRIEGESVEAGVARVVERVKGGEVGGSEEDSDW